MSDERDVHIKASDEDNEPDVEAHHVNKANDEPSDEADVEAHMIQKQAQKQVQK